MFIPLIVIILGFIALILSADRFVAGAAAIAKNNGMPPLLIGLTVVSFGTSAPEILVSATAALADESELAVGNALGSNIANIGLVLGVTALFSPLPVLPQVIKREMPILLTITALAGILLFDHHLSVTDGIILLVALGLVMHRLIVSQTLDPNAVDEADVESLPDLPSKVAWSNFILGLLFLVLSSKILVWGATEIATALGVSTLVIGLSIVAIGTSLPELAATMACALKGHNEIAIGNVIGSNLFNLLAVMAVPGIMNPIGLDEQVFFRDYLAMSALTLVLAVSLYTSWYSHRDSDPADVVHRIGRRRGSVLITIYALYYYWLFITL